MLLSVNIIKLIILSGFKKRFKENTFLVVHHSDSYEVYCLISYDIGVFFSHILMFVTAYYFSLPVYLNYIYSDLSYITVNRSLAAQKKKRRTSGLHVCMVHRKSKGGLDLLLALLPTGIVYRMVVGLGGTVVCRS